MEHLEHEWDQQREQLSALLDDELDEQERAELEAHLPTCAACRAELESLRRGRALLRALPQPTLPRNFALPLAAAPIQAASPSRPAPAATRRPASAPPARITSRRRPVRMLQWFSTIAAVLGLILLCSSALASLPRGGASTAATNSGQEAPVDNVRSTPSASPSSGITDGQPGQPTPAPTASQPTATQASNEDTGPSHSTGFSPNSSAGLVISIPGLGALLLILSVCGFTVAWWLRRRW